MQNMVSAEWLLDLLMLKPLQIERRKEKTRMIRFENNGNSFLHKRMDEGSQYVMHNKLSLKNRSKSLKTQLKESKEETLLHCHLDNS